MDGTTPITGALQQADLPDRRRPIASQALSASGIAGGISLVFLILMFIAFGAGAQAPGMTFGWVNDVLGLATCVLALPAVVGLHQLLGPTSPRLSRALVALGLVAFCSVVVLQLLLIAGVLTFEQQIGPVSVAYLLLAAWLILTGRLGSVAGTLPDGVRWGLLAAVYVGYPFWAIRTARFLERSTARDA
jgi:hypothetical protein